MWEKFERKNKAFHHPNATHLLLVRHGETDWNREKRIQGKTEVSLNEKGKMQIGALSSLLTGGGITGIYSSPLNRARESAEIIHRAQECPLILDHRLREAEFGNAEGMLWSEFQRVYQREWQEYNRLSFSEKFSLPFPEGAESFAQISERFLSCLYHIIENHPGENIVVMTHGFVMRALLTILEGFDDESIFVSNGGFLFLRGMGKELTLEGHQGLVISTKEGI